MRLWPIVVLAALPLGTAQAQETLSLTGEVMDDEPDHVRVPFEVPAGVVEIEVAHDDLSEANILDWGLEGPDGFRGWGGGNTEPAVVGIDGASRSYLPGPIVAGTWNLIIGKAKLVELPAPYAVTVTLRNTATLPPQPERQPYVAVAPLSDDARWYAGDFHVHSRESGDAAATLDEILTLAAARGLDFVVITDHNTVSHDDFLLAAQARHPNVLLVPGIEVTTYDGHIGAIGATSFVEHKIKLDGATIEQTADAIHGQGALLAINHPAFDLGDLCIGCGWDHELAPEAVDAMEIATSGAAQIFLTQTLDRWEALVASGAHVAALGGSDDHRAGVDPGTFGTPIGSPTTMVFAEALSVDAIVAGVRAGRTVVKLNGPEDAMIDLSTEPALSGDAVSAAKVQVRVTVSDGDGANLRLVADGAVLATVPIVGASFVYEMEIVPPPQGALRLRAEVGLGEQTSAITSHVWLATGPAAAGAADGGCACRSAGDSSNSRPMIGVWLLALLAVRLRRRPAQRR